MHSNLRISKLLALSVFMAAMGLSPSVFGDSGNAIEQVADTDDATLATKVRAALIADPKLKTTLVNVAIEDGAVQLSGIVRSKNQDAEAVKVATQVEGVKSVDDNLEVKDFLKE